MSLDVCACSMTRVGYSWPGGQSGVWPNAQGLTCGRDWHVSKNAISCAEDCGGAGGLSSSLRQPGLAHPVAHALALSLIGGVFARCARAEAGDGESGIEGKPGLNRGPRLIEPAKMR